MLPSNKAASDSHIIFAFRASFHAVRPMSNVSPVISQPVRSQHNFCLVKRNLTFESHRFKLLRPISHTLRAKCLLIMVRRLIHTHVIGGAHFCWRNIDTFINRMVPRAYKHFKDGKFKKNGLSATSRGFTRMK